MKQVAEGVKAAPVVMKIAAEAGVDMPIAARGRRRPEPRVDPLQAYRGLINVAPGHEVYGEGW